MMPPCSCEMPGRKPGTSSNVTMGMLKQSQKRTKRAPFKELSMSNTPARYAGWFATTPTDRPSRRAKPRSEEHTSELQSHLNLVFRLLLEKKKKEKRSAIHQQRETHFMRAASTYLTSCTT